MAAMQALQQKMGDTDRLVGDAYEKFLDERAALNKKYPEVKAFFEDYMEQILYAIKLVGGC